VTVGLTTVYMQEFILATLIQELDKGSWQVAKEDRLEDWRQRLGLLFVRVIQAIK